MKFLANENFPYPSIKVLRDNGLEVYSIGEESSGISDEVVLKRAVLEDLIILRFDRDYGELLFKYRLAPHQQLFISEIKEKCQVMQRQCF